MKITALTTYRVAPRWLFLKVETDEGITGWGEPVLEGRAKTVEAAVQELGATLIGTDPARINDHWQAMYRTHFYRGGAILMSAIARIDQVPTRREISDLVRHPAGSVTVSGIVLPDRLTSAAIDPASGAR